jgi:hypothetical protein
MSLISSTDDDESEFKYIPMYNSEEPLPLDIDNDDAPLELNPNMGLVHSGVWIPKKWNSVGRHIPLTGVWECCGEVEHHSIYCPSYEARDAYRNKLQEIEEEKKRKEEYAEMVKEKRRMPWEKNSKPLSIQKEGVEDVQLRQASEKGNAYNVLMLITWLVKNLPDEAITETGLKLMEVHSQVGDGCVQMYRHNVIDLLCKASEAYRQNSNIQLNILIIFQRLLECNYTRESIISTPKALNISFLIGHYYMSSVKHVEHATACVLQCARHEVCRKEILDKKYITYLFVYCKKYSRNHIIIRNIMKLLNWVTSTDDRLVSMYEIGGAKTVLKCMERHMERGEVLAPALLFLTRLSKVLPEALDYLIHKKAVSTVIKALRTLYDQEIIQLEALRMLKTLSQSPEGWKQISDTRGGWQSICQGTTQGNALVHDLKGSMHNPGWAVGDTHNMPKVDRMKIMAAKAAASKGLQQSTVSWTSHALKQYMGQSMKPQTLGINVDFHEAYFDLIKTLELLPKSGEEKEYWFIRIHEYERENLITIDEMVETVLKMKKRESIDAKNALLAENNAEYIKPVYVMGMKISTKALEENDIDITAQLNSLTNMNA